MPAKRAFNESLQRTRCYDLGPFQMHALQIAVLILPRTDNYAVEYRNDEKREHSRTGQTTYNGNG